MTSTDYLEQGIAPKVGGVIWSPHEMIYKRGYPLVHKILDVKRKKRGGKLHYQVTVKTTNPLKKVVHKSQTLWLDQID